MPLRDDMLKAIQASGESMRSIAITCNVRYTALWQFCHGYKGLGEAGRDRVYDYLKAKGSLGVQIKKNP